MSVNTHPEREFTPEQRQRLGQVYAMILRWHREDKLKLGEDASLAVHSLNANEKPVPAHGNITTISASEMRKE